MGKFQKLTSRAVMQAYVDFALAQPSLYRLMFSLVSKSLMQEPSPGPQVRQMVAIATEAFRRGHDDHDVRDRVISAWGMAHGLLDLWRSGSLPAKTPQRASEYIIDQMVSFGVVS